MNGWGTVAATIASEFSDIPDLEQLTTVSLRLSMATLLGGLIGLERELTGKPAGLRTHMLVAIGSALFVLIPVQAGMALEDLSRVFQGLLAGVGFLCAGAILKGSDGDEVHGLTTATSLWMTAAIGMGAGVGRETLVALGTLLALAVLRLEKPISKALARRKRRAVIAKDDEGA